MRAVYSAIVGQTLRQELDTRWLTRRIRTRHADDGHIAREERMKTRHKIVNRIDVTPLHTQNQLRELVVIVLSIARRNVLAEDVRHATPLQVLGLQHNDARNDRPWRSDWLLLPDRMRGTGLLGRDLWSIGRYGYWRKHCRRPQPVDKKISDEQSYRNRSFDISKAYEQRYDGSAIGAYRSDRTVAQDLMAKSPANQFVPPFGRLSGVVHKLKQTADTLAVLLIPGCLTISVGDTERPAFLNTERTFEHPWSARAMLTRLTIVGALPLERSISRRL